MPDALSETIARNRAGEVAAIPSVCSAHPSVLKASLMQAEALDRPILIEATSNQVNQDGGYTGMRPADFVAMVHQIADDAGCDRARITFGGDHLGPQAWKSEPAEAAMAKAEVMLADYVQAGFSKIHLDCSEGCAGEPAQLDDDTVATRAAGLAEVCEAKAPDPDKLRYIVGTEVPPPGGARETHVVTPTEPDAARATLTRHFEVFAPHSADRIVGLVVQPGVEFAPLTVDHLPPGENAPLRRVLNDFPGVVFEAHSTDYQKPDAYQRLARMGFAIQKVGPALTFAYREAVYGFDILLDLMDGAHRTVPSPRAALETAMLANPAFWQAHYHGSDDQIALQRHFGWSDRLRYYWPVPDVVKAVAGLQTAVDTRDLPEPLLRQVFSTDLLESTASIPTHSRFEAITLAAVQAALAPYFLEEGVQ